MALTCPSCGSSNDDGARFCSACGSSLSIQCPACGTEAVPGARFCSSCGAALAEPAGEPASDGPAPEERKVVSVLFCDLAGFTAHTERSDPEDVRARLTVYHARVRRDVERFGGRVEKLMGDGVFAVFGAPIAHEDDPERAVRAALRILDSVDELNSAASDLALVVRVAVTTGEAIVQLADTPDREGIIGDVVNTASRLEAIAEPGTVVTDERTYLAARNAVDFEALPEVALKGKAEPVPIWRVTAARSRFGVAVDEEITTPFVGRAEELALLVDAFERTVARQSPQLVTVVGEPGVGKSRLIHEFRRALDDRSDLVWWRQGRCLPYGEGVSFWAIGELVKAQAGILESEPPTAATTKLDQAVRALVDDPEEAAWVALRLRPLAGLGGGEGTERSELFTAWLRFFESLAAKNPLVMVIEDLHWADDPVVEFLDQLLEWAGHAPILLVGTARPELLSDRPDWGAGKRDAATIGLAPLTPDETAHLMAALAERPVMSADLQRTLLDRSGGNPLYVTEYVRLAEEEGWFDRADRGIEPPLPDSIQAIIDARIDLLSPADKTLLQTAAVVGRVFWSAALSFADAGSPAEVSEGLRRLVRRDLVRPVRRSSMQGQEEFSFAHILIRDAAYQRLTRTERARLHEATARWLEAVSGDRVVDVAELLAHHLATAFELAPSDEADRRRRIYRFFLLAAERSASLDAERAAMQARRAVEFAGDDRERGQALVLLGKTTFNAGGDGVPILDEAIACFARAGDAAGEAHATSRRAHIEWYRGNAREVDRLDARALQLVEGLAPSQIVAEVMVASASKLQLRGREEESLDLVERGLRIAREVSDTLVYARGLVIRGTALVQIGEMSGLGDIEEALRIQLDRNDSERAMKTYNNLATIHAVTGHLAEGLRLIDEAIDFGTQRGLSTHVAWSQMTRCEILFPMGRWDELLETTRGFVNDGAPDDNQIASGMRAWESHTRFMRGEVEAGWSGWQNVLKVARAVQDPQILVPALAVGVDMAWTVRDLAAARSLAEEFAAFASAHPVFLGDVLVVAARPMVEMGMAPTVAELHAKVARSDAWLSAKLDGAGAVLAAAAGEHQRAIDLWERHIELTDRHGAVLYSVLARTEAGRSALAMADLELAESYLGPATVEARALKAKLLLGRIDDIRQEPQAARG